jgi:Kyakuja-Dileera-Zisupton transposase
MDGGNSAKRVAGSGDTDERVFLSDYHISRELVDHFKDDVLHHSKWRVAAESENPTDNGEVEICTERWKAANTLHDSTVKVFEQTGIFISACRYGIVEFFCEMYRSGELYVQLVIAEITAHFFF